MIAYWSLLLAFAWVGVTGAMTVPNLLVGYAFSWFVLVFLKRRPGAGPLVMIARMAGLLVYFVWELILANLRVAYDIVTPQHHMRPAVIGIPLDATTDEEITLLANLITLTPGTLSLDVYEDRKTLYVHAMYVHDRDELVRSIKEGFERRVLEVMR